MTRDSVAGRDAAAADVNTDTAAGRTTMVRVDIEHVFHRSKLSGLSSLATRSGRNLLPVLLVPRDLHSGRIECAAGTLAR